MVYLETPEEIVQRSNVYTNAMATMFIYTSYFAGQLLMPTALRDDQSIEYPEQIAFIAMAIHSLTAALSCPIACFLMRHIGTHICLVIGSLCCVFYYAAMCFPATWNLYTTQALFGFGLALIRPASLKYLTLNSNCETLAPNNGTHWAWFMSSMIWGNGIVCVFFKGTSVIDTETRCLTYGVLGGISLIGTVMYVMLRKPIVSADSETARLLTIKQDLEPQNLSRMIRETFTPVLVQETLLLILPMLAAGFLFIMYCVQIPTLIGFVSEYKYHISLFGMFVGVGEFIGALISAKIIPMFGYVLVSIFSGITAILALLVAYLYLPIVLPTGGLPTEMLAQLSPSTSLIIALALAFGLSDAGNNTVLSILIGKLFAERSEVVYSILSCVMNIACCIWFIVSIYAQLDFIIIATALTVLLGMFCVFMVVRPK